MNTDRNALYPLTYLDREGRQNSKFYFISYSHKDKDVVFEVLHDLYKNDVNYWYDIELDPGDNWSERVRRHLEDKSHCIGGILFLSINSLGSKAVRKEIEIMKNLQEERDFRILPVIIGYDKARKLILDMCDISEEFYKDHGVPFFQEVTEHALCLTLDVAIEEISKLAEKDNVKEGFSTDVRSFNRDVLNFNSNNGKMTYTCGTYPFDENGEKKEIEWNMISNTNEYYYLITKYCIDFVDINSIQKIIDTVKRTVDERIPVKDITLINEEFMRDHDQNISSMIPTDYADRNRQQLLKLYWVLEGDGNKKDCFRLYNTQKIKINENILKDQINAGVRLILTIKNEG